MAIGFQFNGKDFQSCTDRKEDAQYLHSRFKLLKTAIENTKMFNREFANLAGYLARPINQGSKKFRDHMWIGFADGDYKRPQDEVQFQVGMNKNAPLEIELFIHRRAQETKQRVKTVIEKHKDEFINLVRGLSNCTIGYSGDSDTDIFQKECKNIKDADIIRILRKMDEKDFHFFIRRKLSKHEINRFGKDIILKIVRSWIQYQPLYDLMNINNKTNKEKETERIEKEIWKDKRITETEKETLIKARKGQGKFREDVLSRHKKCPFTGVSNPIFLTAGHLKPWASCSDNQERLDPLNGFPLTPVANQLIDQGFVTFDDNGVAIFSKLLKVEELEILGISLKKKYRIAIIEPRQLVYLKYHREKVFEKNQRQKREANR